MMEQRLKLVGYARAGNVVAIRGLGHHILTSAILSLSRNCPLSSRSVLTLFYVNVWFVYCGASGLEALDLTHMAALTKGLRLLNNADSFVEISVSATGEQSECFKTFVSYKETIEGDVSNFLDNLKALTGSLVCVEKTTPNGRGVVRVQVVKLAPAITKLHDEIEALEKRMMDVVQDRATSEKLSKDNADKCRNVWFQFLRRIWILGPRHVGPIILLVPEAKEENDDHSVLIRGSPLVSQRLGFVNEKTSDEDVAFEQAGFLVMEAGSLKSSVLSGFQLSTGARPLCDEPIWGMAFFVEANVIPVEINPHVGQLCSKYAVLSKIRARVLKEEMQQGSSLFTVHAYVLVTESLGFAQELLEKKSAASSALLVLSHWEELSEDPFVFGDSSCVLPNTARKLIDAVRRRKGLPVEENVVQHATKQRTLSRKV
ncbi:hypothetical protein MKX01_028721 [Papaver californicum]|nr:hypothetical protein MKX01_028721 [Papaver californicum]